MPYLTMRKNLKLQLSPGLVASYDIQPGNGVGLFWDTTHTPDPHWVVDKKENEDGMGGGTSTRRYTPCTSHKSTVVLSYASFYVLNICALYFPRWVRVFVRTVRRVYVRSDCVSDPAVAVRCPFHDAYYFSYQDAVHEMCQQPLSYAKPCVGATDYQLHFKHCQPSASLHAKGSLIRPVSHLLLSSSSS